MPEAVLAPVTSLLRVADDAARDARHVERFDTGLPRGLRSGERDAPTVAASNATTRSVIGQWNMGPTTDNACPLYRVGGPHAPRVRAAAPYDRTMRYLSDEWIAAVDEAVRAASADAPTDPLVIDQHVTDVVSYRVRVEQGSSSITRLAEAGAGGIDGSSGVDAAFTQDLSTAVAVAAGETDAHQAFLLGRIRFTGDADVLIRRRDAFSWLAEILAPVMARTDFA